MPSAYTTFGISELTVDPLDKFEQHSPLALLRACGLIPGWFQEWTDDTTPIKELIEANYPYGLYPCGPEAAITPEGVFTYPGDPDCQPLLRIKRGTETFYMYQHAMAAIVPDEGAAFITRID